MSPEERALICKWPQLGARVVQRLEDVGFDSIQAVLQAGVDEAVERVCALQGTGAFRNRAASLKRFVEALSLRKEAW